MRNIIIFGAGGVGSWLAHMLVRHNNKEQITRKITIVDHDKIEPKNLQRQLYYTSDINRRKATALKETLQNSTRNTIITCKEMKVESEEDLIPYFNKNSLAIIATDNQESKNLIANYFHDFIITNCDHDFAEVKTKLDNTDLKTWQIDNGYGSKQDIQSNVRAAQMALTLIITKQRPEKYQTKVQTEMEKQEKAEENGQEDNK